MQPVHVLRAAEVRPADRRRQGTLGAWRYDRVHVVGHQAVGVNPQPVPAGQLAEEPELQAIVAANQEDVLAVVAALGNVMRHSRDDDPSDTWHARRMPIQPARINNM